MTTTSVPATNFVTLWVREDCQNIDRFTKHFTLVTSDATPVGQYHIIALVGERSIRQVLRKLQGISDVIDIKIFPGELLLFESFDGLMLKSQPADRWLEIVNNSGLELKEALAIAEDLLKLESDQVQLNLDLDQLRQRVSVSQGREMSSWEWDKKYIEPLKAKVFAVGDGDDLRKLNLTAIKEQIRGILGQDLKAHEVEAAKITIRISNPAVTDREFRNLWSAVETEFQAEQLAGENTQEIDELIRLGDQTISLSDFLPADLANPIAAWCQWLNIREETALTALLAGTSSLHQTGTELIISRKRNFTVPPTIYAALVSESGQKKSPIYRTLIRQPLDALEADAEEQFKATVQDWREEMKSWQAVGSNGEAPPEPARPPVFYFTDANGEGIKSQAATHPSKTLMGLVDELAGLFNSHDKYRNGRGSDRQDYLSYFDGSGAKVLRAGGVKTNVRKLYLSLFGTIQPDVLKRMMMDCSDPDGQWARFLFVNQPLVASDLDDDDCSVDITGRITEFYRWLAQVPEMEYVLSRAAYERYRPVYRKLERLRVSHPQAGMRAVYSKMEGYIGRLAINLHVCQQWADGLVTPETEIPLEIMEKAIALAKFYIGQTKLIHFNSDDSELAPTVVKLISFSRLLQSVGKDGWVKAKDFVNTLTKKHRPKVETARAWMREAVALGFGCIRGAGSRLEFCWRNPDTPFEAFPEKVDEVDEKVDDSSTAEMPSHQALQEKVDEVDEDLFSGDSKDVEEVNSPNLSNISFSIDEEDNNSSTSSTFLCDAPVSSIPEVDESSTFRLPDDQSSTFFASVIPSEETAPKLSHISVEITDEFMVGDLVIWLKCPAHCANLAPWEIIAIDDDYAKLDLFEKPVPISELRRPSEPTA
jgi:hypothetical protein